jgi:twitching motility two-component system response regulator PilH
LARKILLADDSVTAQNMGRKILADAGYEVITVNNGSAALKKILEIKPDLVILDVYMPGYSGLEVCQRLKETPDSSRVPVLLTVGKLEPFKPEEAQRVRAEAFIVKPFEASELLSALSKLEDKVVPRAEPSKPGRFARAIASVEEASHGRVQPIDGGDENGWKNRISFPHEKTEPEEKVADDVSIYNPINRDLRTVVATPAQRVEEKKEEEKQLQEMAVEQSVDLAAVAPQVVPQDVTPEEVAAIAAAAAQIHALQARLGEEKASAENAVASSNLAEAAAAPEAEVETTQRDAAPADRDEAAKEAQDIPVTMAAASAAIPRWTAVSVALDAEEARVSLEQEMQKAYAAFAAEQGVSAEEKPEAVPPEGSSMTVESPAEQTSTAAGSIYEAQSEPAPEEPTAVMVETPQEKLIAAQLEQATSPPPAPPESVGVSETANPQPELECPVPAVEVASAEVLAEPASSQFAEPTPAPIVEPVPPHIETAPEPIAAVEQEVPSPAQHEPEIERAEVSAHPFTSFVSSAQDAPSQEQLLEESQPVESAQAEAESVKSTAAAWANWRQIRDANEPKTAAPEAQQQQGEPASLPAEAAAMAVAAGAEQAAQAAQETAQADGENPADVASIVDSVLADLRPRLMAEISRKMSEKK